jgi:sulfatase maturation enzyme AslB (radical SAM superfamily)
MTDRSPNPAQDAAAAPSIEPSNGPSIALAHLDHLWFQVSGTLCNLTCHHCFISCSPHNRAFGFLTLQQVRGRLQESVGLGVKEYYFTGGEPFLNPELTDILIETLHYGPASVLTNATVLRDEWLQRLKAAEAASRYSLEFRVSLDGFDAETNDPIRGEGTFARTMDGIIRLVQFDFLPIVTAARTWDEADEVRVVESFVERLREAGYQRPRLKILPTLRLGAELQRSCGYLDSERVTEDMLAEFDRGQLVCDHSRIVTDRGVHVCPILIDAPDSLLGQTLDESRSPFKIGHGACFTCYQYGAICSNASSGLGTQAAKGP